MSEAELEIAGALLPAERGRGCRSAQNNRRYFECVMWIARTGAQWRRLPDEYCGEQRVPPLPALDAVLFLATNQSRWVDGRSIEVSGGANL